MTQEEKQLLLVDLCGRLPYGMKCIVNGLDDCTLMPSDIEEEREIKPYLRLMSSMTEEEEIEYDATFATIKYADGHYESTMTYKSFDLLNKKMFDYRGLIPMGLALKAKEGMYVSN